MTDPLSKPCTAFEGHRLVRSGPLAEVAVAARRLSERGTSDAVLVFDDATGRVVEIDPRGSDAEMLERLSRPPQAFAGRHRPQAPELSEATSDKGQGQRGRGRPKLGVVAREVTLLPRQWEWLAAQPGGASVTLRRLVDGARQTIDPRQQKRARQEAAYKFMLTVAGDLPGYEEATRALFADDRPRMAQQIKGWPEDVQTYALRLAFGTAQDAHGD